MTAPASPARPTATKYIKTRLRDDIAEEYANAHDDVYPDDDYVDAEVERRFNEQFGA